MVGSILDTWSVEFRGYGNGLLNGRVTVRASSLTEAIDNFNAVMPAGNFELISVEKN